MAKPISSFLLMLVVILMPICTAKSLSEDAQILLEIKSHWTTHGFLGDWQWQGNADSDNAHCNWIGVSCNEGSTSVVSLNLGNLNISGPIPNSIGKLRNLTSLNLSLNYFDGAFPAGLLSISSLRILDLSNNDLVGSLPEDINKLSGLICLNLSGNNFFDITSALALLPKLQSLRLEGNKFSGRIPVSLGNLSSLKELGVGWNSFRPGHLPEEIGKLFQLEGLYMEHCNLIGPIPKWFGNFTNLRLLDLSQNYLEGNIPDDLMKLPELIGLDLFSNHLSGRISDKIGNITNLKQLDLTMNRLTGSLPASIGDLASLELLHLYNNNLAGPLPSNLAGLKNLVSLIMSANEFSGSLPAGIGMSPRLKIFEISSNRFSGALPRQNLCNGKVLEQFTVQSNRFSGRLPAFLGKCPSLFTVRADKNLLSGKIPKGLWTSPALEELNLAGNGFTGVLPLGISYKISVLNISDNRFSGSIPSDIGFHSLLSVFVASNNNLSGNIPADITRLPLLTRLSLDRNDLSGELPQTIFSWKSLTVINVSHNRITGKIPDRLSSLRVLNALDLSDNQLSGPIPSELGNLNLDKLNLSGNNLGGQVPQQLDSVSFADSFLGNPELCGNKEIGLPSCNSNKSGVLGAITASVTVTGVACIALLGLWWRSYRRILHEKAKEDTWEITPFCKIGFTEWDIVRKLKEENIIGTGSSGTVYRVTLPNGAEVAAKTIETVGKKTQSSQMESKDFETELQMHSNIKHDNILKLLCCISAAPAHTKILIYDFMQNGSLYDCLHHRHSQGQRLRSWRQRYHIAHGTARALRYLHHDCIPPLIHRDVKSANILLDSHMKPHLADFGLATRMETPKQTGDLWISKVAGSIGYIPPEYAYSLKVTEKTDVYSFGVVLLELLTGKNPAEEISGVENESSIVGWARKMVRKNVEAVLDSRIAEEAEPSVKVEMLCVLHVALQCTASAAARRPSMRDVLETLVCCRAKTRANDLDKFPGRHVDGDVQMHVKRGRSASGYFCRPSFIGSSVYPVNEV